MTGMPPQIAKSSNLLFFIFIGLIRQGLGSTLHPHSNLAAFVKTVREAVSREPMQCKFYNGMTVRNNELINNVCIIGSILLRDGVVHSLS